jgi:hypothetical protein
MPRKSGETGDSEKIRIEPPKPRRPLPPPERTMKDKRKEAELKKTRRKVRPETEDE